MNYLITFKTSTITFKRRETSIQRLVYWSAVTRTSADDSSIGTFATRRPDRTFEERRYSLPLLRSSKLTSPTQSSLTVHASTSTTLIPNILHPKFGHRARLFCMTLRARKFFVARCSPQIAKPTRGTLWWCIRIILMAKGTPTAATRTTSCVATSNSPTL